MSADFYTCSTCTYTTIHGYRTYTIYSI